MRLAILSVCMVLAMTAPVSRAQEPAKQEQTQTPVIVEYYYRIKWGSADEFKRLYEKNHAPLLREMKKSGLLTSIRLDEPFTHIAGGPRWDWRVTLTFPSGNAAISDPEWGRLWKQNRIRMYENEEAFFAEEDKRFSLLEDHWDVVLNPPVID